MTKPHSTRAAARRKPSKPRPDFPLFPHAVGKWAKKIKGKLYYFGRWDDPQPALEEYLRVRDDLLAGRTPPPPGETPGETFTVRDAVNHFLTAKRQRLESGELSQRSFDEYHHTAGRVVEPFGRRSRVMGLRPEDFNRYRAKMAKVRSPIPLGNEVQRVRTIFKWCYGAELIDRPVRFGPDFKRPARRIIRKAKQQRGPMLLTQAEILALLDELGLHLKAMVFLGIN